MSVTVRLPKGQWLSWNPPYFLRSVSSCSWCSASQPAILFLIIGGKKVSLIGRRLRLRTRADLLPGRDIVFVVETRRPFQQFVHLRADNFYYTIWEGRLTPHKLTPLLDNVINHAVKKVLICKCYPENGAQHAAKNRPQSHNLWARVRMTVSRCIVDT